MGASDRLLDVWCGNRVEEIHKQMRICENNNIEVEDMQHWPGEDNIADIATKGKAKVSDVWDKMATRSRCTAVSPLNIANLSPECDQSPS